jgi:hypothetical protein
MTVQLICAIFPEAFALSIDRARGGLVIRLIHDDEEKEEVSKLLPCWLLNRMLDNCTCFHQLANHTQRTAQTTNLQNLIFRTLLSKNNTFVARSIFRPTRSPHCPQSKVSKPAGLCLDKNILNSFSNNIKRFVPVVFLLATISSWVYLSSLFLSSAQSSRSPA